MLKKLWKKKDKDNKEKSGENTLSKDVKPTSLSTRVHQWKHEFDLLKDDAESNLHNTSFRDKKTMIFKVALLLFIMIGIPILLIVFFHNSIFSKEGLADLPNKLSRHRGIGWLVLTILQFVQILVCFIPGQPIQVAASYLYGIGGAYLISIIGAIIGTIVTYHIARFLGTDFMHLMFGEEHVKDYIHKLNSRKAYMIILLIYLIPGVPKDIVSYIAGISDIKIEPFLILSTIGRTPGLIGSMLLGKFWASHNIVGIVCVCVISAVILILCFKKKDAIMKWLASF